MRNDDKAELFLNIVSETLDKGGTVVIPSFAVGRTQEIVYELNKLKEKREGKKELPPLYTAETAQKAQELFIPVKYDEIIEIDEFIKVRFNDAGHMLGSSIIEIWAQENRKSRKSSIYRRFGK